MIIGWDISTSIVGVTVLEDDGTYVSSTYVDLRKCDDIFEKIDNVKKFIDSFISPATRTYTHFVEDRLGNFTAGRSMLQTLMKLASFNMVVSWLLWERTGNVFHIHPSTVKATMRKEGLNIPKGGDKKKITLDFVSSVEKLFVVDLNRNDKPQPWCYDMADSYIVARAGYLRKYLISDEKGKKISSPEAGA